MGNEAKSVEKEKKRVPTLFLFGKKKTCAKRKRRDEEAMEGRRDMEKTCPLQRKHFDQTFLKSLMRGANPRGGDGGTNPQRYDIRKRMEISGKDMRASYFGSAEEGRYISTQKIRR